MTQYIRSFSEISIDDIPLVGGKNASLGEMYRELSPKGIRVPNGFAVTADAYNVFLETDDLGIKIQEQLRGLDVTNVEELEKVGKKVRHSILETKLPDSLTTEIIQAYRSLSENGTSKNVAVRSSATAEDLPDASFAGQQESYLNISGITSLLHCCHKCFASLFTNRAISYRTEKGFDHFKVALSIGVQEMVRSDLASSGVIFTIDTESGFRDVVLITSSYGLGENIVQGVVNPDEFLVFKPTLKQGYKPILQRRLGSKEIKMIYDPRGGTKGTRNVSVSPADRLQFSLVDDEIIELARWASEIEDHYTNKSGVYRPMDIEWAKDGRTGELFILQARPETVQSQKDCAFIENYHLEEKGKVLVTGRSVGAKIGQGKSHVIRSAADISKFNDGEVLITEMTDPDWEPIMKKAAGIITERGGRTCHAAIISRELGVPAIVGAEHATGMINDGSDVTVSCAEGELGKVYEGLLKFNVEKVSLQNFKKPKIKVMTILADPDRAFGFASIPNDGVGLARMEFIIDHWIKIHPMALINYPNIKNPKESRKIEKLTKGYTNKPDYFVDKMSQGIAKIAAAFHPNDVILRLSDFKSNEYAHLIGGNEFEPVEDNPMIGFRGASRYYNKRYIDGFVLECKAAKKARDEMGLRNLKLMIPFCRTVEEGKKVLEVMEHNDLIRGENGLEVYMMCEVPSNVILANEFAKIFDGFSIGSNDLTQLTLGLDRDSEIVADLFDERNAAITTMVSMAIKAAKENGIHIGICGQAPSDYPEFAEFLVKAGIDSISLNPDVLLPTMLKISEFEEKLA